MSELVDHLRESATDCCVPDGCCYAESMIKAADEIERLKEARVQDALAQLEHANACSAEIERLRQDLAGRETVCDSYAQENQKFSDEIERLLAENEELGERTKMLDKIVEKFSLALIQIRTMQGNPIEIAREALDTSCAHRR